MHKTLHKHHVFEVAAAALFAAASAHAVDYTYDGTTVGGATFNRPFNATTLSGVGTDVAYSALSFTVSASGSYSFLSTAVYDNFTLLYTPSFLPAAGLTNLSAFNDDQGSTTTSGFTQDLTAGTAYVFVTTAYYNFDTPQGGVGTFTNVISGPGTVIAAVVPEPATYALMALGLALVGGLAKRRSARR